MRMLTDTVTFELSADTHEELVEKQNRILAPFILVAPVETKDRMHYSGKIFRRITCTGILLKTKLEDTNEEV